MRKVRDHRSDEGDAADAPLSPAGRGPQVLPLLTPPLDQSAQNPGYIKGYPPRVRENGGKRHEHAVDFDFGRM